MVYPEHRRRSGFQEARVILLEFFLFRHLDEIALGYVMENVGRIMLMRLMQLHFSQILLYAFAILDTLRVMSDLYEW